MNIVKLDINPNQSTIDYARELLARCESGETVELTVLESHGDGTYTTTGSPVSSRFSSAGMLLAAAMDHLNSGKM